MTRAPSNKPVYHLVFGTRSPLGVWHFGDCAARAEQKWWQTREAQESARDKAAGVDALFEITGLSGPDIEKVEADALPVIAENIARLAEQHGRFKVGDYPVGVFGDYLGVVREKVVRAAIKKLHAEGRTPSDGKGSPISGLIVARPER